MKNSKIYEINTRVWIKRFAKGITLGNIPEKTFIEIANLGFDAVWLMGIWKTSENLIEKCCFTPDLISSYNKALNDWEKKDIIGSPYAIDAYEVNPVFGKTSDLIKLKEKLNGIGLKLFLDFVPNHFSAETRYIKSNPQLFLQGDEELLNRDSLSFYKPENSEKVFVHGRDPFFLPWTDTVQVNFFSEETRHFLANELLNIAQFCDGIRCDMAMLPLNNVFYNTWLGLINKYEYKKPDEEFWKVAISKVKEKYPDFVFIAETYWDLEYQLQKLGFDFTYDKQLTDRLLSGDVANIKSYLLAEHEYQMKSVRFIENHDEERAVTKFGKEKSLAAAVVISTIKGLKLYYDGQLEGKKIKLPVQLGKEPEEKVSERVGSYYHKLLEITNCDIFKKGKWTVIDPIPANEGNLSYNHFLSWTWDYNNEIRLVVINYSAATAQCRLKLNIESDNGTITFADLLTGEKYFRTVKELSYPGLFIELKGFNSHIFSITG